MPSKLTEYAGARVSAGTEGEKLYEMTRAVVAYDVVKHRTLFSNDSPEATHFSIMVWKCETCFIKLLETVN